MSTSWLAAADPATAWAHRTWNDFANIPDRERTVVILPVHGFADHGLGLPLDAEEITGSALLATASTLATSAALPLCILPPLRFALAPYPRPSSASIPKPPTNSSAKSPPPSAPPVSPNLSSSSPVPGTKSSSTPPHATPASKSASKPS
jgi:creatinine amidohydrolase